MDRGSVCRRFGLAADVAERQHHLAACPRSVAARTFGTTDDAAIRAATATSAHRHTAVHATKHDRRADGTERDVHDEQQFHDVRNLDRQYWYCWHDRNGGRLDGDWQHVDHESQVAQHDTVNLTRQRRWRDAKQHSFARGERIRGAFFRSRRDRDRRHHRDGGKRDAECDGKPAR